MMNPHNLNLMIEAMATQAKICAMKMQNAEETEKGSPVTYSSEHFWAEAEYLHELSNKVFFSG